MRVVTERVLRERGLCWRLGAFGYLYVVVLLRIGQEPKVLEIL